MTRKERERQKKAKQLRAVELDSAGWGRASIARELGISTSTLYLWLNEMGIPSKEEVSKNPIKLKDDDDPVGTELQEQTKKILDPSIQLHATCVRVPVFISHAVSANVEMEEHVSVEEAREAFSNQEGCVVVDYRQDEGYVTPKEAAGEDAVYVSRIREDITAENGLAFWCVSDNLRKGAALNAVQIAEKLIEMKII